MSSITEALQAGLEHHRAGRLQLAESMYRKVLQIHPRHAGAMHLLGLIAFQAGHPDVAAKYVSEAIRLDRFHAPYQADLGEIQRALGNIPEAIVCYQKAIELDPESADAHNHIGTLYQAQGDQEVALASFREALEYDPNHAAAHRNLGIVLQTRNQLDEARAAYERSVQLAPDQAESYYRLGACLYEQGQVLDALACFQRALKLQPDYAEALCARGLVWLGMGQFAEGWAGYEARIHCPQFDTQSYSQPRWDGSPLGDRTLLVHAEQGLGDTLQFIRYAKLLQPAGGKIAIAVPPALVALLTQSGFTGVVSWDDPLPPFDVHLPLMSLPYLFQTQVDTVPRDVPYLAADPARVEAWRGELQAYSGLKVGIAWQGRPEYRIDAWRSIPLACFAPLAAVDGVHLLSLQKGHGSEQLAMLAGRFEVIDLAGRLDQGPAAFLDTAAVIKNLDVVVTSDSAIAHLAGGLGVPVWLAVSAAPDWRWLQSGADSPWYPTMRLFRQTVLADWKKVFADIATALAERAAGRARDN